MKKIIVFGISDNLGGIESYFHNYFENFNDEMFQIDFIAAKDKIAFQDDFVKKGSKIYQVPFYRKHPIKYMKEIKNILIKNNYDIAYVNMLSVANIMPLKYAYKYKIPTIISHSHNAFIPHNLPTRILHKINKNKLEKYVTLKLSCSKKAGDFMFTNDNYTIINNAINSNNYTFKKEKRESIRQKLHIDENSIVIGHIGKFCEQKNQKFIIKIANVLKSMNNYNFKFLIIGGGEKNEFIDLIKQLELEDMFIILDTQPNAYDYYNAFDIFILPSLFEGLPVVGIEAQFNGLPCIFSSEITEETKYNSNVTFCELDEKKWADLIINANLKRINPNKNLYENYEIENQKNKLIDLLLETEK